MIVQSNVTGREIYNSLHYICLSEQPTSVYQAWSLWHVYMQSLFYKSCLWWARRVRKWALKDELWISYKWTLPVVAKTLDRNLWIYGTQDHRWNISRIHCIKFLNSLIKCSFVFSYASLKYPLSVMLIYLFKFI